MSFEVLSCLEGADIFPGSRKAEKKQHSGKKLRERDRYLKEACGLKLGVSNIECDTGLFQ